MSTSQQIEPLVVPAGTGPFVELGDHRGHVKVSARNSGGDFALYEMEVDLQGGVPPHIHTYEDETFYILEGRFTIQVGEQIVGAGPGDTVFAPRHLMHTWRCASAGGGRVLILITPAANFEAFAIEMAQRGFVPSAAMTDPLLAAEFMALTENYGIEMLSTSE